MQKLMAITGRIEYNKDDFGGSLRNRCGKADEKGSKMKKRLKPENSSVPPPVKSDMAGLIVKMQHQIFLLEKKIDTLIGLASTRPVEAAHHPKPFQRFDQPHRQGEARQANDYRERTLHKAICADCNKECEVPFRPSGDRPVYCKECFSKRKAGSSFKANSDNRPREREFVQESHSHKHRRGESRGSDEKKKYFPKKRKKR